MAQGRADLGADTGQQAPHKQQQLEQSALGLGKLVGPIAAGQTLNVTAELGDPLS